MLVLINEGDDLQVKTILLRVPGQDPEKMTSSTVFVMWKSANWFLAPIYPLLLFGKVTAIIHRTYSVFLES